jgi:hypothetical protein
MWVLLDDHAPDGFIVGSFAGDPFDICRDHVRAKVGLPSWKAGSERGSCKQAPRISQPEAPGLTDATKMLRASQIFSEGVPIKGTLAETYLVGRIGRTIDWPADIRFHKRCGRNTDGGLEFKPAIVALLRDIKTDDPKAIQRIFLRDDGQDRLRDSMGKCSLGLSAGTVCKLSPDDAVTHGLGICEGLEKGLAIMATGFAPVWVTCGTAGLASFPVLSGIEHLTIFADHDEPGLKAARACAERWGAAGKTGRIVHPKQPGSDWNDVLIGTTT